MYIGTRIIVALLLAPAAFAQTVDDGHGREWRQVVDTVGLTWTQVATVCPRDGLSSCSGAVAGRNLTDWIWATDAQVLQLFSYYDPLVLTGSSDPFSGFAAAESFLSAFRPTQSHCITYSCGAYAAGWTASLDANGQPVFGSVGWGTTPVSISGGLGIGPAANPDESNFTRGVWLFRETGPGVYAYDDAGSVASPAGGVAVASVLANDWVAGVRATTANVSLSVESSTHEGVTLDVTDGSVDVAAGTSAGTHTLIYWICDSTDASRCDDALVTVVVRPYVIDAVNDSGAISPAKGGTAIASVLANDLVGSARATLSSVSLELLSASSVDGGVTLDLADGSVDVARGTALGVHSLTYRICERANPANCDTATASVNVRPTTLDAVNDYARASSKTASTAIASVLANDTYDGARATTANVTLTRVSLTPAAAGITLDTTTGAVKVAAKTDSGTYALVYRICEIASPTNCDTATATLELSGRSR